MKNLKRIINGAFVGVGIGYTVSLIYSAIFGAYSPGVPKFIEQFDSELTAVFFITLAYMVLGIIQSYATLIMENEKRSLLLNTLMHYFLVVVPLLVSAYVLYWSRSVIGLISVGLTASLVYFIIWVTIYKSIRKEISKINDSIEKRNPLG